MLYSAYSLCPIYWCKCLGKLPSYTPAPAGVTCSWLSGQPLGTAFSDCVEKGRGLCSVHRAAHIYCSAGRLWPLLLASGSLLPVSSTAITLVPGWHSASAHTTCQHDISQQFCKINPKPKFPNSHDNQPTGTLGCVLSCGWVGGGRAGGGGAMRSNASRT